MAIQFIVGASGNGKTSYMYEKMITQTKSGNHSVIYMLPEQANMSAEKELISIHPNGGTMDISVLSFTRLAFKVFDELNVHTKDVLDDFGKNMLIMKVLQEKESNLNFFQSMIGKQGFVDEMKSILSEFYQYQITKEHLQKLLESLSPQKSLYHKISDLYVIFQGFEQAMQDTYMVAEQLLTLLKEVLSDSSLLRGVDFYFDCFTGFTPAQFGVIEELMRLGGNLYFSVTMDADLFGKNDYSEQGLFAISKQMVDRICHIAQANDVKVLPHIAMEQSWRLQNAKGLYHLERNIFRFPFGSYEKEAEEIEFVATENECEELHFLAKRIQKYVREEGYSYADIAIVYGDLKQKKEWIKKEMECHQIPYFMDDNECMKKNPLAELFQIIERLFLEDYSYESVFALLKTGFLNFDQNAIFELENYVIKYGVRGYQWWNCPFKGGVKGLHEINETRATFMKIMEPLMCCFAKKKNLTKEYITTLYEFLVTNKIPENLHEKSVLLEGQGAFREAKAYSQVYDKCLMIFDKIMDIAGEDEMERNVLMEMLQTGIKDMKLGVIPSTLDQVLIGDIERSRLQNIKVLFVAGLNEGILPKNEDGNGILAERDREQIKMLHVDLAPTGKEEIYYQQFYFYLQITKASEHVIFSYREKDTTGGAMHPSYYLNRLCKLFPKNEIKHVSDFEKMYSVSKQGIVDDFVHQISCRKWEDSSVLRIVQEEYPEQFHQIMQGYFYNNNESVLERALVKKLYGNHMIHSVSRLETFSACAYQFFLQYGLKLQKNEEYNIETNNIGTILHAVMEDYFTWVRDEKVDLKSMNKQQRDEIVTNMTREAAIRENETIFESSFRNRHMLDVLIRIAKRSVDHLCRHLSDGDMEPTFFEEEFSPEKQISYIDIALMDGVQMEMRGIVDRVDIKETEDAVYYKVIDYKSGAKDIDYIKMYEGRQLQLTVYMSVMDELLKRKYPGKKVIPTGMYYYHLYDPVIEEQDEDKLEKKRIESSRLSGLVNQDETCLTLMDQKTGTVTPVRYKKDGDFAAGNKALVTEEELRKISGFVRGKMIEIGNEILSGNISMNPEKGDISSPCNVCDFQSICRFEVGLGGNAYKIAPQMSKEEAKDCILGKESTDELDSGTKTDH